MWTEATFQFCDSSHRMMSLLLNPGHQIQTRMPETTLSIAALFPLLFYATWEMWRVSMTAVNCASVKRLLLLTSSPPLTDYKDKSIPTLIISTSHLIFLREAFAHFCAITGTVSVNTPQEFDPRFPRLSGASRTQAWQGDMSPGRPVPGQHTPTYQPHWGGLQVQEWTSPPAGLHNKPQSVNDW